MRAEVLLVAEVVAAVASADVVCGVYLGLYSLPNHLSILSRRRETLTNNMFE